MKVRNKFFNAVYKMVEKSASSNGRGGIEIKH